MTFISCGLIVTLVAMLVGNVWGVWPIGNRYLHVFMLLALCVSLYLRGSTDEIMRQVREFKPWKDR